jgi:hypothetical protein
MALFPNVDTLRLCGMEFGFAALASLLGARGQLKSLFFHAATAEESDPDSEIDSGADLPLFDLTALEELVVIASRSRHPEGDGTLLRLLQHSQPRRLQTLSFGDVYLVEPYCLAGTEKLLKFGAPSLVNLIVDPAFPYTSK